MANNPKPMKDFEFVFDRQQTSKIPRSQILDELERVAEIFKYTEFKRSDFNKIARIHSATAERDFGNWSKAMDALRNRLNKKGIELTHRHTGKYTEKEMFEEMEHVWQALGHRPSKGEWMGFKTKISYDTYARNFNGWQNACLKFIEYKMGRRVLADNEEISVTQKTKTNSKSNTARSRNIPLGIRLKVLNRDNFRCVLCGRSPATDIGVELHLDHITPFSKGGEHTAKNLRILCKECNLGKGNNENY